MHPAYLTPHDLDPVDSEPVGILRSPEDCASSRCLEREFWRGAFRWVSWSSPVVERLEFADWGKWDHVSDNSLSLSLILWLSLSMYVSLYLCISVYMHRERERKKNTLWSSGERSYQPVSRLAHGLTKTEALLGAQLRHSAFGRATWRLHTFGDGVAWENDQIFTNLIELSEWLVHMTFSMQTAHIPKANRDSRGRRSRPPKLGRCIPARCHPWSILKPGHFGHMGMVIIFTMLCRLCRGWDCSVWN